MSDTEIEQTELDALPRWACVAFASRCARRVAPVLDQALPEGSIGAHKVLDAVDAAVAAGRKSDERSVLALIDEIHDLDLKYRSSREDAHRVACKSIAAAKLSALCVIEDCSNVSKQAWDAYRNAASAACFSKSDDPDEAITNSDVTQELMREDFDRIKRTAGDQRFDDDTPVIQDAFGPMWPRATPSWALGMSQWDRIK